MPARSQSQRGLIFARRDQYGSKKDTPKKWKWIWDDDWENKGKLPKKVKKKKVVSESLNEFLSLGKLNEDTPIMDLPQFEDLVINKLQEMGLTWEESDFAIGQIDPEQMDEWRMDVIDGISSLADIAIEVKNNTF
jgi:hypothetical protein